MAAAGIANRAAGDETRGLGNVARRQTRWRRSTATVIPERVPAPSIAIGCDKAKSRPPTGPVMSAMPDPSG